MIDLVQRVETCKQADSFLNWETEAVETIQLFLRGNKATTGDATIAKFHEIMRKRGFGAPLMDDVDKIIACIIATKLVQEDSVKRTIEYHNEPDIERMYHYMCVKAMDKALETYNVEVSMFRRVYQMIFDIIFGQSLRDYNTRTSVKKVEIAAFIAWAIRTFDIVYPETFYDNAENLLWTMIYLPRLHVAGM